MKTKNIFFGLVLSLFLISCNKDEIIPTIGQDDVATDIGLQEMSEDVNAEIVTQTQRNIAPLLSNTPINQTCPTITIVETVVLLQPITIKYDYGTGCTNSDNKYYEGIIIVKLSNYTFDFITKTIGNYTLDCEYINFANKKYKLNGTSKIVNTNQTWTIDFDHKATALSSGKTFTRKGTQVREYLQGFGTATANDDRIKATGNWITTTEKGAHNVKITTPFIIDFSCIYKAKEGVMTITRSSSTAVLDYGYKKDPLEACDNWYQLTINKFSPLYLQFGI